MDGVSLQLPEVLLRTLLSGSLGDRHFTSLNTVSKKRSGPEIEDEVERTESGVDVGASRADLPNGVSGRFQTRPDP